MDEKISKENKLLSSICVTNPLTNNVELEMDVFENTINNYGYNISRNLFAISNSKKMDKKTLIEIFDIVMSDNIISDIISSFILETPING